MNSGMSFLVVKNMMHKHRTYFIRKCQSFKELAELLFNHSWCLCTGFQVGNYLFQIESLTVSWVESEVELIEMFAELGRDPPPIHFKVNVKIDTSENHRCELCA
jgi:hypothetical protein